MEYREYLGDGVYAGWDGYHLWLTTENGITVTNRIALEPTVLATLDLYRRRLGQQLEMESITPIESDDAQDGEP